MSIKAILFDHDGTLVDSEPAHFRIWRQVLSGYGVDLSERQYAEHYAGVPARASALDVISRFSIAEAAEALVQQKARAMGEFLAREAFPPMPGALQIVRRFHALGLRLAIVTGSDSEVAMATTRTYSLEPLFKIEQLKNAKLAFEKQFIQHKLSEFEYNVSRTAKAIGVERSYLHRRIKKLEQES